MTAVTAQRAKSTFNKRLAKRGKVTTRQAIDGKNSNAGTSVPEDEMPFDTLQDS